MRASAAIALAAVSFASTAHAYVRSRTQHGTAVHWPGGCVYLQPDADGSPDLDPSVVFSTIQASMNDWMSADSSCSYLVLKYDQPAKVEAHLDGKNVVKFRTDKWCHPDDTQNHDVCYDKAAAAITTVFYLDRQGESDDGYIIDADIELNSIDFTFITVIPGMTNPRPRSGTTIADLENTLTHEMGHVQGLDHTCGDSATPTNEVDENGNTPPACNMLAQLPADERTKIIEATMYNSAMPGETKKRTPELDDVAGICAAYPIADASKHSSCSHTDLRKYNTSGCDLAPGAPGSAAFFLLVGFCLLALRATRRRQGR